MPQKGIPKPTPKEAPSKMRRPPRAISGLNRDPRADCGKQPGRPSSAAKTELAKPLVSASLVSGVWVCKFRGRIICPLQAKSTNRGLTPQPPVGRTQKRCSLQASQAQWSSFIIPRLGTPTHHSLNTHEEEQTGPKLGPVCLRGGAVL